MDDVSVQLASAGKFGQVQSGLLMVTGHLGVFRIDKENKEDLPVDANGTLFPTKRSIAASWDTKELEATSSVYSVNTNLWRYSTYGDSNGKGKGKDKGKGSGGKTANALDVFYMPFRVMDADANEADYEMPMLTGLLLSPTGKGKGVYRRIGQLELSEQWHTASKENSLEAMTESTNILDQRFFTAKHKRGQYSICII